MKDRVICCEDEKSPHSENEAQEGSSEADWVEVCSIKVTRRKKTDEWKCCSIENKEVQMCSEPTRVGD